MDQNTISAIVCAAGSSVRMGPINKLMLEYRRKSLIAHTVSTLLETSISEILVVTGHEQDRIIFELEDMKERLRIVNNPDYRNGQTSSIQLGLKNVNKQSTAAMICLSDMPLLQANHFHQLMAQHILNTRTYLHAITRPICDHNPGHPVIIDRKFFPDVLTCEETEGCRSVIRKHIKFLRPLHSCDPAYFTDVDKPGDLEYVLLAK